MDNPGKGNDVQKWREMKIQDIQESLMRLKRKGQRSKWLQTSLLKEVEARFYKSKLGKYNFTVCRQYVVTTRE